MRSSQCSEVLHFGIVDKLNPALCSMGKCWVLGSSPLEAASRNQHLGLTLLALVTSGEEKPWLSTFQKGS